MSKRKRSPIKSSLDDETQKQEEIIQRLTGSPEQDTKSTVRITIDIPKNLHQKIKTYTKSRGQTIKGYLLWLATQDMEGQ